MAVLYLGLTSQAKDVIELYNYYYQTKNMPIKQVNEKDCDICKKSGKIYFRVKSINHTKQIFYCNKCWDTISKEHQYSYGGTRKSLLNIDIKSH